MNFDLNDEQKMLSDQMRRLLVQQSPPDRLRQLIDAHADWDEPLWRAIAEFGVLGAALPEEHGGLALSLVELCVVAQELGRAAAAVPFLSSIGLAAEAIRLAGSETQEAEWLPRLADGSLIATFAYSEGAGATWPDLPGVHFSGGHINGVKSPVADLAIADIAVVTCLADGERALALVDLSADGVDRARLESFDTLKPQGRLILENAPAELLAGEGAASVLNRIQDQAAILAAFEQMGGTEACLYMVRDYAMERRIFGRSLASYQVVKHKLADIYVALELARSNAFYAAWAIVNEAPDATVAAAAAHLAAGKAFELAARENLQLHGGLGYTFEADCHFHYRRERLLAVLLGGPARWRQRLIDGIPAREIVPLAS